MAAQENTCEDCKHTWSDNKPAPKCPLCGSDNVYSVGEIEPREPKVDND